MITRTEQPPRNEKSTIPGLCVLQRAVRAATWHLPPWGNNFTNHTDTNTGLKVSARAGKSSEGDKWGQHQWFYCNTLMLFDMLRGTFWVLPFNLLLSSQKCQGVLFFFNLSKLITFAAVPLVLTTFARYQKACPSSESDGQYFV